MNKIVDKNLQLVHELNELEDHLQQLLDEKSLIEEELANLSQPMISTNAYESHKDRVEILKEDINTLDVFIEDTIANKVELLIELNKIERMWYYD